MSNIDIEYWCHTCAGKVRDVQETEDGTLECNVCKDCFVEIIDEEEKKQFDPQPTPQININSLNNARSWQTVAPNGQVIQNFFSVLAPANTTPPNISVLLNQIIGSVGRTTSDPNTPIALDTRNYFNGDIDRLLDRLLHATESSVKKTSKHILDEIKHVTITNELLKESKLITDCAICKDEFVAGDVMVTIECSHSYHVDCLRPWLEKKNTCPVCRYELPVDTTTTTTTTTKTTTTSTNNSSNDNISTNTTTSSSTMTTTTTEVPADPQYIAYSDNDDDDDDEDEMMLDDDDDDSANSDSYPELLSI